MFRFFPWCSTCTTYFVVTSLMSQRGLWIISGYCIRVSGNRFCSWLFKIYTYWYFWVSSSSIKLPLVIVWTPWSFSLNYLFKTEELTAAQSRENQQYSVCLCFFNLQQIWSILNHCYREMNSNKFMLHIVLDHSVRLWLKKTHCASVCLSHRNTGSRVQNNGRKPGTSVRAQ